MGGFSARLTAAVFADAYAQLQQRYIDPIDTETLALAGLERLKEIDPGVEVAVDGDILRLTYPGTAAVGLGRPTFNDSREWGAVMAVVLSQARASSASVAALDPEDLYAVVFDGITDRLDRYSRYESARQANLQRESRNGFGGIGVVIRTADGRSQVMDVIPDGPAAGAGVEPGDVITHVDGVALGGLEQIDVIDLLRGRVDSRAVLDLTRGKDGPPYRAVVQRQHMVPRTVIGTMEHGVARLRVSSFNRETAEGIVSEVERLTVAHGGPLPGLILDLRNNPGGLLDQAVFVSDLFLTRGPVISTRGRHPAANSAFAADDHEIAAGVPMAVLINGHSASASELVAAALQDRGRAVVVGSTTHGKGSVQNLAEMPNGGELIITWSRMVAPSGYLLDGLGVLPQVCTSRGDDDPLAALNERSGEIARQFRDWHRYDRVDEALAERLRAHCPQDLDAPSPRDPQVAAALLRDATRYRRALAPGSRRLTATHPQS